MKISFNLLSATGDELRSASSSRETPCLSSPGSAGFKWQQSPCYYSLCVCLCVCVCVCTGVCIWPHTKLLIIPSSSSYRNSKERTIQYVRSKRPWIPPVDPELWSPPTSFLIVTTNSKIIDLAITYWPDSIIRFKKEWVGAFKSLCFPS